MTEYPPLKIKGEVYEDKLKLCQKYNEIQEIIKDLDEDVRKQIEELI